MPLLDLTEAARCAVGRVYVHPVSKELVKFTAIDFPHGYYTDPMMEWRQVTGNNRGRAYASTVFKDDGRWVRYEGTTNVLPYSYRI